MSATVDGASTRRSSEGRVERDLSCWPVVVVRLPAHMGRSTLEEMIDLVNEIFTRREPFVLVIDARAMFMPMRPPLRRTIIHWMEDRDLGEKVREFKIANVVLVRSAFVRAAMKAVFHLRRPRSPTHSFERMEEALPCIRKALAEHGMTLGEDRAAALIRL